MLTEVINEEEISLRHFVKSILEGNLYFGPLEVILLVITRPAGGYE